MKYCLRNPTNWVIVFPSHAISPSVFGKLPLLYLSSNRYELHLLWKLNFFNMSNKFEILLDCASIAIFYPSLFCVRVCECVSFFFAPWNENEFTAGSNKYDRRCVPLCSLLPANDVWMWNCFPYRYVGLKPQNISSTATTITTTIFFTFHMLSCMDSESLWNSCSGDWSKAIILKNCLYF